MTKTLLDQAQNHIPKKDKMDYKNFLKNFLCQCSQRGYEHDGTGKHCLHSQESSCT